MDAAVFPTFDQSGALEHREMLGDRGCGNREWHAQLGNGARTVPELAQYSPPDWVGECAENPVEQADLVWRCSVVQRRYAMAASCRG